MAGKKITELSSSIAPSLTGVTAVAFGGTTYKSTLSTLRQILVDSGSHRFTGSQFISGSLTLTGSMPNLTVGSGTYHVDNPEILHVQNSGSYNIAHFEANNQYYAQVNIKNTNSGSNSSTDLVITADNGTEGVHYVDLGINGMTVLLEKNEVITMTMGFKQDPDTERQSFAGTQLDQCQMVFPAPSQRPDARPRRCRRSSGRFDGYRFAEAPSIS
jgi:hypothetical protein